MPRPGIYCRLAPKAPTMSDCSKMPDASAWPGPWKPPWMRAPDSPLAKVPSGPTARSEKISALDAVRRPAIDVPDAAERRIEAAGTHVVVQRRRPHQPVALSVPGGGRSHHDPEPGRGSRQRAVREASQGERVGVAGHDVVALHVIGEEPEGAMLHPGAERGPVRAHVPPGFRQERDAVGGADGLGIAPHDRGGGQVERVGLACYGIVQLASRPRARRQPPETSGGIRADDLHAHRGQDQGIEGRGILPLARLLRRRRLDRRPTGRSAP